MPILHPWTLERPLDQVETLRLLVELGSFYAIISECVDNGTDTEGYWKFLKTYWGGSKDSPTIIIEQDNVPTPMQVEELWDCQEQACCIPYRLANDNWSVQAWIDETGFRPAKPPFKNYLPGSGFGTTKINYFLRSRVSWDDYPGYSKASDQPTMKHWSNVDFWFSLQMQKLGIMWHVHKGEVKHNHRLVL